MATWRSRLLSAVVDSFFSAALTAVLSGTAVGFLVSGIAAARAWNGIASVYLAVALGSIVSIALFALLMALRQSRVVVPAAAADYKFTRMKLAINYTDPTKVSYRRRYCVEALRNGLDRIGDSYAWTGDKILQVGCTAGDCEYRDGGRSGLFTLFELIFPTSLRKGESIEIEVTWVLDNTSNSAIPFISRTVTHPTDLLAFEVQIPVVSNQGDAYLRTSPHIQTQMSSESVSYKFDEGYVAFGVQRPRLFSHYELRWRWK